MRGQLSAVVVEQVAFVGPALGDGEAEHKVVRRVPHAVATADGLPVEEPDPVLDQVEVAGVRVTVQDALRLLVEEPGPPTVGARIRSLCRAARLGSRSTTRLPEPAEARGHQGSRASPELVPSHDGFRGTPAVLPCSRRACSRPPPTGRE